MRASFLVGFVGVCVAVFSGCSRCGAPSTATADADVAEADPSSTSPAASSSSSAAALASVPVDVAKTPSEIAKDATPPTTDDEDVPVVRIATSKGKLVAWSAQDGEMSLVLAGYESAPGVLANPAKIVRRTSGRVAAIDAMAVSSSNDGGAPSPLDDVAIVWDSGLGESSGGQLIALVYASVDLAKISAPITLGIVRAPVMMKAHVMLAKNPKAGGVIVMHEGPTAACDFMGHASECKTFEVKAVSPAGKVDKLGSSKLDGGPSPEYCTINLDNNALGVYGSSMRGGRSITPLLVPYVAGEAAPAIDLPVCGGLAAIVPEIHRGTKGELIAVCMGMRPEKGACAKAARNSDDRCGTVAITGTDGHLLTPKNSEVNVLKVDCTDGKQRITTFVGDVTLATTSLLLEDFTKARCGS